jgi:uncharacterized protein HemX
MGKRISSFALLLTLAAGIIGFSGCTGVSEEKMAELDALRSEVKALDKEVGSLKAEKAAIERDIAVRNAQLDQCAKEKAETKKNLEKLGL